MIKVKFHQMDDKNKNIQNRTPHDYESLQLEAEKKMCTCDTPITNKMVVKLVLIDNPWTRIEGPDKYTTGEQGIELLVRDHLVVRSKCLLGRRMGFGCRGRVGTGFGLRDRARATS